MAEQTLAVRYRPQTFEDVVEQGAVITILRHQLETGTLKSVYLFCGGAGTGKTTLARIFAKEINHGVGSPIEVDAASNNSVDDVRNIIQQARMQSIDSEYKIIIMDEVHMLSNSAWNALLKILEEPPAKTIFIFATTNPEKIPNTILSRVQRYDFQRISQQGIVERLKHIITTENAVSPNWEYESLDYIAKLADGGMRDAITMLDKCLSYSSELSIDNIVISLGKSTYSELTSLTDSVMDRDSENIIKIVEGVHASGRDVKQFIREYTEFILDILKYISCGRSKEYIRIPATLTWLDDFCEQRGITERVQSLLDLLLKINAEAKWDDHPKDLLEAHLLLWGEQ